MLHRKLSKRKRMTAPAGQDHPAQMTGRQEGRVGQERPAEERERCLGVAFGLGDPGPGKEHLGGHGIGLPGPEPNEPAEKERKPQEKGCAASGHRPPPTRCSSSSIRSSISA